MQASRGQLALLNGAKPISEVIQDERTPPRIRDLLKQMSVIKHFGEENGLKPTKNYTDYVNLNRSAAVWVVSACEPLKFVPRQWSFPVVGSFTYLGWFDLEAAKNHARDLKKENLDVDVRGATAYSTLGWFKDSVLSSMIPEGDAALGELADVVLHESVHATYYIKNQSYFNESIASFVADELTPEYLKQVKGADSSEAKSFILAEESSEKRERVFHAAYIDLENLYNSNKADSEKLSEKQKILDSLKQKLGTQRDFNNATLIQFKTYGTAKPEFEAVFRSCGSNWSQFWKKMKSIDEASFEHSQQEKLAPMLLKLAQKSCD